MKINPTGFYSSNYRQLNNNRSKEHSNVILDKSLNKLHSRCFSYCAISFTKAAHLSSDIFGIFPCYICGRDTLSNAFVMEKLTQDVLSGYSQRAVEALLPFERFMRPVENNCFQLIKQSSQIYPDKNLFKILESLKPKYSEELRIIQFNTLERIDSLSKRLPPHLTTELKKLTDKARQIISVSITAQPFKRMTFISIISQIVKQIPDRQIGDEINLCISNLNSPENALRVFIIENSQKNSMGIGKALIDGATATEDHIIAQKSVDGRNGTKKLLACKNCNDTKKNDLLMTQIERRPEMIQNQNPQRHFNFVVGEMLRGKIPYQQKDIQELLDVAQILEQESNGLIKVRIDISALRN